MDKLDHLGWVVQHSYRIGEASFGIRSTSEAFSARLDEILAAYRHDEERAPYYSIVVGDDASGDGRRSNRFHILYRGTGAIVRTLDLGALVRTLASELESFLLPDREDAVYAHVGVVSLDGVKALAPTWMIGFMANARGPLVRSGLRLPAETFAAIDPDTGMVVPMRPRLDVPPDAWGALAAAGPNGVGERLTLDGPTRVDVVFATAGEAVEPVSRGIAVHRLAGSTVNLPALGLRGLEGLLRLVEGARCYSVRAVKAGATIQDVASAMREEAA